MSGVTTYQVITIVAVIAVIAVAMMYYKMSSNASAPTMRPTAENWIGEDIWNRRIIRPTTPVYEKNDLNNSQNDPYENYEDSNCVRDMESACHSEWKMCYGPKNNWPESGPGFTNAADFVNNYRAWTRDPSRAFHPCKGGIPDGYTIGHAR
jgi:hypothetical protein